VELRVKKFDVLDSTNLYTVTKAREGEPEGLVVWTDYQTKGRGRMGRTWVSPKGKGLLVSFLLRPAYGSLDIMNRFTRLGVDSVIEALEKVSGLKGEWDDPNDVVCNGSKISGILVESATKGSRIEWVVIGMGINVNTETSELPEGATSLWIEAGKRYEPAEVLTALCEVLTVRYKCLMHDLKSEAAAS